MEGLRNTFQRAKEGGLNNVKVYWHEGKQEETWRNWKDPEVWDRNIDTEKRELYTTKVKSRRIIIRTGPYILRWGKSMIGTFSTRAR